MMALQNGFQQRDKLGHMLRGGLGHVAGEGFYTYNNNYALVAVYSFLIVGLRSPVHSRTCTRTHAHAQLQFR